MYVPKYYKELSGRRLITMEYVEGKKINDKSGIETDLKLNTKQCAAILLQTFALMIFKYGHIHCDAHPGNLLIRQNPKDKSKPQLVILDHGFYKSYD